MQLDFSMPTDAVVSKNVTSLVQELGLVGVCNRPKEEQGDEEPKAEEKQEDAEADGNESGLDELMLLAGSRRLSVEPERTAEGNAGSTPQREGPTGEEPQSRDEDEVHLSAPQLSLSPEHRALKTANLPGE